MQPLTLDQYLEHANRTQQPDLLDAANDTALADMRAQIESTQKAIIECRPALMALMAIDNQEVKFSVCNLIAMAFSNKFSSSEKALDAFFTM